MNALSSIYPPHSSSDDAEVPPCVLVFNANDPTAAAGLAADILAVASVGAHPLPVATGVHAADTTAIFDHYSVDDEALSEQARAVLEDLPVQAIKVGFAGSAENLGVIAGCLSDHDAVPVVGYMPDLSWWQEDQIDAYHDAFEELLMPLLSVLVGNHSTLWRWLLPDWESDRVPSARDLAMAAGEWGVPYLLVTGLPAAGPALDNVLASPQSVVCSRRFGLLGGSFAGAGDTLSATLAALIACGNSLDETTLEALGYLDRCLAAGFRPGMGRTVPDRLFWAQPEPDGADDADAAPTTEPAPDESARLEGFAIPPHDTQH